MNNIDEVIDKVNKILKTPPTKQQTYPYIWDYNIKLRTKDGYDYEEETKVKKLEKTLESSKNRKRR